MDSHGSEPPTTPPVQGATSRSVGADVTRCRQTHSHPILFSWQASDARRGSCGVTSDPLKAGQLLEAAMTRLAPGGVGMFRIVRLDPGARVPSYVQGRVLARLRRSSAVVVSEKIPLAGAHDSATETADAQDDDGRPRHG